MKPIDARLTVEALESFILAVIRDQEGRSIEDAVNLNNRREELKSWIESLVRQ